MKFKPSKSISFAFAAMATILFTVAPSWAQVAGGNQQIFQDERMMMMQDSNSANQAQNQLEQYEQQVQANDSKNAAYRLYAEQRVQALEKLKAAGGSPSRSLAQEKNGQMYALEKWLAADAQTRAAEQAHIRELERSIQNLQQTQNATLANMNSDINNMRENQEQAAEDDRFNKMMAINQFNELQSEMGAASWGRPPTDGTFNSTGGYGMGGGYGYSFGGGRRW
jgi:hypothetical protein